MDEDDRLVLFDIDDDDSSVENMGNRSSENMDEASSRSNADSTESYDANLPAQHSYLGNDMEELQGRTILEEGEEVVMVLLLYPHVVLMPGQKLPIQLIHPATVSMMLSVIEKDKLFGLINRSGWNGGSLEKAVGTTAEVRYYKTEDDHDTGLGTMSLLALGSQRFTVINTWRNSSGILYGKVRVLEEVSVTDCLAGAKLPSMERFNIKPLDFDKSTSQMALSEGNRSLNATLSRKKYDWRSYCHTTWWPWWIYEQYDVTCLIEKLKKEISGWNSHLPLDTSPSDPIKFSYWVAANMPINDFLKMKLLSLHNAIQRLRAELAILKSYMLLKCRDCGETIADKKEVFSMSSEGPQGTYVNPNGIVHDTITVYKATGIELVGRPTENHSWFPGYAWIIAQCRHCHGHMGWKFVATKKNLRPLQFWGLTRTSVLSGLETAMESPDWEIII
ncbi:hypothetical protein CHUAL_005615 [Chamberlinius hualienensis]